MSHLFWFAIWMGGVAAAMQVLAEVLRGMN